MKILIVLMAFSFISCESKLHLRTPAAIREFKNPVYDSGTSFADPALIKDEDGHFYAYATQSRMKEQIENVQAARSKNLLDWERLPDAMPERPEWANQRQNFWAPHVVKLGSTYLMYISAEQNEGGYCIGVGSSSTPQGPFKDFERLICGASFENIDPMFFQDKVSHKNYLYWGSAFRPLNGQELSADGRSFLPGSKKIAVLKNKREPMGAFKDRENNWTYAFGHQLGPSKEANRHVPVWRSKNQTDWEEVQDALPVYPDWVKGKGHHYSAQVISKNDKFLMYLVLPTEKSFCLSVGEAKKVSGPFEDFKTIDCSKEFEHLNPLYFKDQSGQFLAWEKGPKVIRRKLSDSGKRFLEASSYVTEDAISSSFRFKRKGYEDLVEGAWITFKNGWYYLYYSGDNCCNEEAHYAVSVARSKKPLGPFQKKGVILKGNEKWLGPGHNAVIESESGKEIIFFHAIPALKRKIQVNENETEVNRLLLMGIIHYDKNGWPVIKANGF